MDQSDLMNELVALQPGGSLEIKYDLYAALFSPGEPDQIARVKCAIFAKEAGCQIENDLENQIVRFIKNA